MIRLLAVWFTALAWFGPDHLTMKSLALAAVLLLFDATESLYRIRRSLADSKPRCTTKEHR